MREAVLREFFTGKIGANELERDLLGSLVQRGNVTEHPIVDMDEEFSVVPEHLVRVCDAVLAGALHPAHLQAIGFCLQASDHFEWDGSDPNGERVSEVASDWSTPEVNYELNLANVKRWKHYLLTGEPLNEQ